jgi:hypothetical protein
MAKSISVNKKSRGRPKKKGGVHPVSAVRLPPDISANVDAWAAKQPDKPGRSEAIRRLVELGLIAGATSPDIRYQVKAGESATKARKLAGELGLKAKGK